ncbi:GNAT family N-acetyltransferase [Anaerovirgula multivorans]|nr:GNAT family N-acetyltransferase [Anaerovirgula multivorans]
MKDIARKQLAIDMNCREEDLINDGLVFCNAKTNLGCRNVKRQNPYLEIATMGKGIVVSGDENILDRIKPLLIGKSREEIFEAPFLYGHSIYYLPDKNITRIEKTFDGLEFFVKEQSQIADLYGIQGFDNAIGFSKDGSYTTGIGMYAKKDEKIVALVGASTECDTMWQIGIDVLPEFRNKGLATYLVNNITFLIMEKGIAPYYCAASSNISSQATAHRSGYVATWMSTYQNAFDGSSSFDEHLNIKKIL